MKDLASLPQPVHVRQLGSGPRQVLVIHCTIAHSGAWKGVAGRLDKEATFTAFDMLSHGQSPDWDGQGGYQDRNVEAAAMLLQQPMDLIGHSFGATVALRLAVEYPELVRSLTLIEPVFFAVADQGAPDLVSQLRKDAKPFADAIAVGDHALGARLFNRMWSSSGSPRWPDMPEATRAAMTRSIHVVPACDASLYDDQAGLLSPGVLDRATMPCFLLRGTETQPVIHMINEGLAQRLPNAQSQAVSGAGHMLPISHPGTTASLLRDFWSRS
ncbi:alpha/beta hydrolase [Ruegeria litorea]|uniref:Alpha/beta hydrolase n=1 Tax=Falsiruegeria litorea TaxID=1280831 RepID=A0ABS5WKH6_9RHOB|nr:alpha/beta hydrolase [Falsiruegeria litorea]MBT3139625.1 alpha/beta hydrolase [Falsiruegeria litorea]